MRTLRGHRHLRERFVFCQKDGTPLTEKQCECRLRKACKAAGTRTVTWHVLRHTFASNLVVSIGTRHQPVEGSDLDNVEWEVVSSAKATLSGLMSQAAFDRDINCRTIGRCVQGGSWTARWAT